MMVDAGFDTGAIEESQAEMITNIFEFSDTPVSEIMTHRTDIVAVRAAADAREMAAKSAESGFSRLPVFTDTIDRITGIICVKDLLPLIVGVKTAENCLAEHYQRPVIYLPESATAKNAFAKLTESKLQMAVITDEYGGTAGIVSVEDLLESIVGNIRDEYDDEPEEIEKISDSEYLIDGLANPGEVFSELGLPLPDDPDEREEFETFDTASAFLMNLAGALPDKAENISARYKNCLFTALEVSDMRITRIRAEIETKGTDINN
jgi:putative hemolysin